MGTDKPIFMEIYGSAPWDHISDDEVDDFDLMCLADQLFAEYMGWTK
jgi:hypothetical protein